MPLPAVIETLDNVDASHRDLYTQSSEGRFILDIEGDIAGHPAVAPLENAFRKEQDKRKRQGRELDALKELQRTESGSDGDENAAGDKPLASSTRRRLEAAHRQDLEDSNNQADKYRAALESTLVEAALTNALVEANIAAPYMKAAKAMHRANLTVVEENGIFNVVAGGPDQIQSPDTFIAVWANSDEGRAFVAAPRNGGGAANGSGAAGLRMPNPWRDESFIASSTAGILRRPTPIRCSDTATAVSAGKWAATARWSKAANGATGSISRSPKGCSITGSQTMPMVLPTRVTIGDKVYEPPGNSRRRRSHSSFVYAGVARGRRAGGRECESK